jgi:hypothetical protein
MVSATIGRPQSISCPDIGAIVGIRRGKSNLADWLGGEDEVCD